MSQLQAKEIEEIRQDLDLFLRSPRTQRPQSIVAKGIGLSGTVISQFISDSYKGDSAEVALKVKAYVERERRLSISRKPDIKIVETSVYRRLRDASEFAYDNKMILAYGNPGIGKTLATMRLAQNDPNIIRIEVIPGLGPNDVLRMVCEALKVRFSMTIPSMFEAARDRLTDSGRLILFDEADYLSIKCFDILRRLHDLSRIGILFVGAPALNFKFRDLQNFKQVDNRIRLRVPLDNITLADAKKIVTANAPQCEPIVATFYKAAAGDARRIESLIDAALDLSAKNGKAPFNDELALEAIRHVDKGE